MKARKVIKYIAFVISILVLLISLSQFMTNIPPTSVLVTMLRLPLQYTAQWILPISIAFSLFVVLGMIIKEIKRSVFNFIQTGILVLTVILCIIYCVKINTAPVIEHNREYASKDYKDAESTYEYQCDYNGINSGTDQLITYVPKDTEIKACLIHINYGGWKAANRETQLYLEKLCEKQGYAFVQLAGKDRDDGDITEIVKSIKDAIVYIQSCYQVEKTYLIGSSAGGNLALITAFSDSMPEVYGDAKISVDGVIALYAPVDFTYQYQYFNVEHTAKNLLGRMGDSLFCALGNSSTGSIGGETAKIYSELLGEYSAENPLYQEASIKYLIQDKKIPLFFIQGEKDSQLGLEDKEELYQILDEKKVPFTVLNLPGVDHAYDMAFPEQTIAGRRTIKEIDQWLKAEIQHE